LSSTSTETDRWRAQLPEPDAFSGEEFRAWRGLIRMRETAMREIARRLREGGEITLPDYAVLITLVSAPGMRLRMSDLAARRMVTPSGITRVVAGLEGRGLVAREPDPADGRGSLAALTRAGLAALRRAQVLHHAAVRDAYLGRLTPRELDRLGRLYEKAHPGVVSADVWPPSDGRGAGAVESVD
jgi:DNA-binding MarR family transcriptional regulator